MGIQAKTILQLCLAEATCAEWWLVSLPHKYRKELLDVSVERVYGVSWTYIYVELNLRCHVTVWKRWKDHSSTEDRLWIQSVTESLELLIKFF